MARRSHEAIAVLIFAVLGCGAAAAQSGQTPQPHGADTANETAPDARLLTDLEILRDLDLLRNLDVLRKVNEARGTSNPRTPPEGKAKP